MKGSVLMALGLDKHSDYMKRYFDTANMKAVIYMCAILIVLETWMILSLAYYLVDSGKPRSFEWIVSHGGSYVVLLTAGIIMIVYAIRYLRGKTKKSHVLTIGLLAVFATACMAFGIFYGVNDYVQGKQILTFLTMAVFVFCLLMWRPATSIVFSIATFGLLYACCVASGVEITYAFQVNLFTMWISVMMVAVAGYHITRNRAVQAESLEQANERLGKANEVLTTITFTDELTGIPNGRKFREDVDALFASGDVAATDYVVLYTDIEGFKHYNDKSGFAAGDKLLCDVADKMVELFEGCPVARLGDDHFVACTPEAGYEEKLDVLEAFIKGYQTRVRMVSKTGVYRMEEGVDAGVAYDRARSAAQLIKMHYGEDRRVYDEKLREEIDMRQHVLNHVDEAVESGWVKPYYQPVMRLSDGTLYGFEALARWDDPKYGLLPPFRFISVLEQHRLIHKIDRCIIDQACREIAERQRDGLDVVPVSVNLSRLDFELCDIAGYIIERCDHYGVSHDMIDVEVTESALSDDTGILKDSLDRLRAAGFSLWLDDFGSGYSSLNVLKEFQFDVLKIDMVFLRDFDDNPKARPMLATIIDLAHELGMMTLTEGIETQSQRDFLTEVGCKRGQGYLFSRPLPLADMHEAMESGRLRVAN